MNKKRLCCFYVNDIHLITMLLPYINERINESTEIITILETDISESANKVINSIQGRKSEDLLNVNWKSKNLSYLYEADIKDKLVLVYGEEEFLNNANTIINSRKENCTILNCYEIVQESTKLENILDKHDKIVNTSGEKFAGEVFTGYTQKVYRKITI